MMRKLLLFFAMLSVSIGTWAAATVTTSGGICTIEKHQADDLSSDDFDDAAKAATKVIVTGPVSTADLNLLSELTSAVTLDLDGCEASGVSSFTVASSVDYVSLPAGMNREWVKSFGEANSGIKSAYSAFPHFNKVDRSTSEVVDEFVCYVGEGGSLRSCINATNDDAANFVKQAKYLTIIGNAMPLDYASGNPYAIGVANTLTSDNHISVSASVSFSGTALVVFNGTGTKNLYDDLNSITFFEATIVSLDMRDMRLSGPNMEADLTLPLLGYTVVKYVVLPIGDTNFKTLPIGCIGNLGSVMSINIPSTVEVLKSGSLYGSSVLYHIWTDGTDENKRYDYGAVLSVDDDGNETVVYADDIIDRTPIYGKWVMPASITYIETYLTNAYYVKDLYMMGAVAPVCEVDAFPSSMTVANNGHDPSANTAKIIHRELYQNGTNKWLTMLHYPVETKAPNIQRYTDPTREYTAATGMKDDKGNTIYLPTQNEFNRAFLQGTTGYVWKAWKTTRNENAVIYVPNGEMGSPMGYSHGHQVDANNAYSPDWDEDSYLSSFYDVTDNGSLSKPATLENYYNVYWNESQYKLNNTSSGVKLYPQAETVGTGTYVDQPVYDANGNLEYEEAVPRSEGTHVQVVSNEYVANNSGLYIKDYTITAKDDGAQVLDYTLTEKEEGKYCDDYKAVDENYYNNNKSLTYYQATEDYAKNDNGNWVFVYNAWRQWEGGDNVSTWGISPAPDRYDKVIKYTEWTNGYWYYGGLYLKGHKEWTESDGDVTRYDKEYTGEFRDYNSATDIDDARYDVTLGEGYRTASNEAPEKYLQHYAEEEVTSYVAATDEQKADVTVTLYKVKTERVEIVNVTNTNDYRGWHQFVLTGYSAFDKVPTIYDKVYTSDTDWWTICMPYDLTYSEVMRYFSDGSKIPVVSKLQYVKRDAEEEQITLCFSKNLMKNKEDFTNGGSLAGVHGDMDDNGVLKIQVGTAPSANDIVLHAGVAYLIKPTLPASASHTQTIRLTEVVSGQTLTPEQEADNSLYNKIKAAQRNEENWGDLVKNAIYTVPAFDIVSNGSLTVDGVRCKKSTTYTYSFVGSLFKSPMPTNCYFLGWDSQKNKAAFWYNKYSDPTDWNWGNMTGIICPNLTEGVSVTPSQKLIVAAHWNLEGEMEDDSMGDAGAKRMPAMLFEVDAPEGNSATGVSEIQKTEKEGKTIYNLNGIRVSDSQKSLAKGVYIVNGKKVVVK